MRLCFVIQRYGAEVAGGAELHCRWLAERLARNHQVEVLATCALDYIRWANHFPPGRDQVGPVPVTRFRVRRPRSERNFARISNLVFHEDHGPKDEREWVIRNGPYSPALVRAVRARRKVDLFIFYCYRYYQTFFGLPPVADRAVLVPTAEEDPAIELPIFRPLLRAPRGILYLTPEEQALVEARSGNESVPSVVVGSGVNIPSGWEEIPIRDRFDLPERYLLYVGRIDRNKGVDRLLAYYRRLYAEWEEPLPLVLVGREVLPIPDHPGIRHLGFVGEEEKFALIHGCEALVLPSRYESLSVIVLEAWAMGRPVLVNAQCRVLEGQCIRSGGGLFYRGFAEFAAALRRLTGDAGMRESLGRAGHEYVRREYDWQVVEERTGRFLERLVRESRP